MFPDWPKPENLKNYILMYFQSTPNLLFCPQSILFPLNMTLLKLSSMPKKVKLWTILLLQSSCTPCCRLPRAAWENIKRGLPWLGSSACQNIVPYTKRLWVQFPVKAYAQAVHSVPGQGAYRRQPMDVSLSRQCFSISLSPSP